jgi:hypothetical protein
MENIIDFNEAKKGRTPKSRRGGGLKMWVDDDMQLQVRDLNEDGGALGEWSCKAGNTEVLLQRLMVQLQQAKRKKILKNQPTVVEEEDLTRRRCRLTRDGCLGPRGCRRRRAHEGQHKDAQGNWSAPWPHEKFCCSIICGGASPPSGSKMKAFKIPEQFQSLLGPVAYMRIGPDGRCLACGNRVSLEAVK